MSHDEINKTNRMELTRIQSGIFMAIASIISPLLLPFAWMVMNIDAVKNRLPSEFFLIVILLVLAGITFFWAGSIVRCVTDIVREYSATSRFGLFILLITPMVWACFGVAYLYLTVASSMATYMGGFGLG